MPSEAVNLTIGGYPFVCVSLADVDFSDIAAIYVVICVGKNGNWEVLDVGQSGRLGSRVGNHDRRVCWMRNCQTGSIWVCVYRMPSDRYSEEDRLESEATLRQMYRPPCGKR